MKILVFSDSHCRFCNMQRALDLHTDAGYLIHNGDGIKDLEQLNNKPEKVFAVNGNFEDCFGFQRQKEKHICIEIEDKRILVCHGHRHNVNSGLQNLIYSALEENADIALFGHTHVKYEAYIPQEKLNTDRKNGLYLFNPGSITLPRDGMSPSFGIIEIRENGILLSHGII